MGPRALSGSFTSWARRVAEGVVLRRDLAQSPRCHARSGQALRPWPLCLAASVELGRHHS
jgi:hypothetical protein